MSEEVEASNVSKVSGNTQLSHEEVFAREVSAIIAWANTFLKQRDMHANVLPDFSDGVLLITLLEVSFRKKLGPYNLRPKLLAHKLDNMAIAFEFLRKENVQLVSIDTNDLVKARMKPTLNFLWNVLRVLTVRGLRTLVGGMNDSEDAGQSHSTVRETLLHWIGNTFEDIEGVDQVSDFWESFRDGKAFCAVVENLAPGSIDMESMGDNSQENIGLAFRIAEEKLGIPSLLQPEAFLEEKGDEKAVENYMCMLVSAAQGKAKTEAEVNALKEKMEEKQQKKQKEVENLRAQVEEEKKVHQSLLEDLEAMRLSHSEVFESEQNLQKRLEVADEERKAFAEQIENIRSELEKSHRSLQEAHERETALMEERSSLESRLRESETQVKERSGDVTSLQSQVYQLHKEQENVLKNIRSEMKVAAVEDRGKVSEVTKDTLSDMLGAAIRERKGYNDFLNSMHVKKGWLMKRRPGKTGKKLFGGTDYKKRYFVLKGDSLMYYVDDKTNKEKGKAILKYYTKIDFQLPHDNDPDQVLMENYERPLQSQSSTESLNSKRGSVVETVKGPVLRLVPKKEFENSSTAKIMELQAIDTLVLEQHEDIFEWIEEINTRIALINYLEDMFKDSSHAKGSREVVEFILNPENTEFVLENKMTDLHQAFTRFKETFILKRNLSIHLSNVALSDPAVEVIAEIVARNHTLLKVNLSKNMISEIGAGYLADAVARNPKLEELDLGGNDISDAGLLKIAESVATHRNLRRINVSGNRITDVGGVAFVKAIHAATEQYPDRKWTDLDLSNNMLGDETCKELCTLMQSKAGLKTINLMRNVVTDVGGLALCCSLRDTSCEVTSLTLAENQVSSKTVAEAALSFDVVSRELFIDFSSNPLITNEGAKKLLQKDIPMEFVKFAILKH